MKWCYILIIQNILLKVNIYLIILMSNPFITCSEVERTSNEVHGHEVVGLVKTTKSML